MAGRFGLEAAEESLTHRTAPWWTQRAPASGAERLRLSSHSPPAPLTRSSPRATIRPVDDQRDTSRGRCAGRAPQSPRTPHDAADGSAGALRFSVIIPVYNSAATLDA